jgi:hypothetical protein
MPDLKRVCLAAAAVALLAAIAGGQQVSPFRQPPRMPPEIMAPTTAFRPVIIHQAQPVVDLDNAQLRVLRLHIPRGDTWTVDGLASPGELLVAVTPLSLRTSTDIYRLNAGETRWITLPGHWLRNIGTEPCEFLLIQPKRN